SSLVLREQRNGGSRTAGPKTQSRFAHLQAPPRCLPNLLLARPRARCVISQVCSTNLSRCSRPAATKATAERALASRAAGSPRVAVTRAVRSPAAPIGRAQGRAASRRASAEPGSEGSTRAGPKAPVLQELLRQVRAACPASTGRRLPAAMAPV